MLADHCKSKNRQEIKLEDFKKEINNNWVKKDTLNNYSSSDKDIVISYGDLLIEGNLDFEKENIGLLLIKGDLTVTGYVRDIDFGMLMIEGNFKVANVLLSGILEVKGKMSVKNLMSGVGVAGSAISHQRLQSKITCTTKYGFECQSDDEDWGFLVYEKDKIKKVFSPSVISKDGMLNFFNIINKLETGENFINSEYLESEDIDSLLQKGYAAYSDHKYEQTINIMNKVLDLDPKHYWALWTVILALDQYVQQIMKSSFVAKESRKLSEELIAKTHQFEMISKETEGEKDKLDSILVCRGDHLYNLLDSKTLLDKDNADEDDFTRCKEAISCYKSKYQFPVDSSIPGRKKRQNRLIRMLLITNQKEDAIELVDAIKKIDPEYPNLDTFLINSSNIKVENSNPYPVTEETKTWKQAPSKKEIEKTVITFFEYLKKKEVSKATKLVMHDEHWDSMLSNLWHDTYVIYQEDQGIEVEGSEYGSNIWKNDLSWLEMLGIDNELVWNEDGSESFFVNITYNDELVDISADFKIVHQNDSYFLVLENIHIL